MARVGLIQFDILWEDVEANIERVERLLDACDNKDFDLLILPELWVCGFTMNLEAHKTFDAGHAAMKDLSQKYNCPILGGLPRKTDDGQQNRCYLVDGEKSLSYAKIKAFKFAGEHKKYQPGNDCHRWDVAGFQLSPFVCYDLRFPELPRSMVPQSNLFTYVANWPEPRIHHWRQLMVSRALENLSYVIGVNRVGKDGAGLNYVGASMVVAPDGEVLLDARDKEGVFAVDIDPAEVARIRQMWPFLEDI